MFYHSFLSSLSWTIHISFFFFPSHSQNTLQPYLFCYENYIFLRTLKLKSTNQIK